MTAALHDLVHLAKRFTNSLLARPLTTDEQSWVQEQLLPGEHTLWLRMSVADQRHAYGVAQRVIQALDATERAVIAAALLHDIGKVESPLGTLGRSAATVLANLGITPRPVKQYRAHNEIGRHLLEAAGSDPSTSAWAYEHELPKLQWTINPKWANALHEADDD